MIIVKGIDEHTKGIRCGSTYIRSSFLEQIIFLIFDSHYSLLHYQPLPVSKLAAICHFDIKIEAPV